MTNVKVQRKDVYSQQELEEMFSNAAKIVNDYFALRAAALISLFKTGKRRGEVAGLEITDVKEENNYLFVTFRLEKKRRKALVLVTKRFPLSSRYAQHILRYRNHMTENHPKCKYLFPSIRAVFGMHLAFSDTTHLTGRQVLNIIKGLNQNGWCHLFRETRGAEIVKKDEQTKQLSIFTVYKVKHGLDLERETTAWHYINRYATEVVGDENSSEEIS